LSPFFSVWSFEEFVITQGGSSVGVDDGIDREYALGAGGVGSPSSFDGAV
jgi:hypothetical protein